jgi:hypothetical protein
MGIDPNYLYSVVPNLANEGLVRHDGQDWYPDL